MLEETAGRSQRVISDAGGNQRDSVARARGVAGGDLQARGVPLQPAPACGTLGGFNMAGSFDGLARARGRCGVRSRQAAVALELLDFSERLIVAALGHGEGFKVGSKVLFIHLRSGFGQSSGTAVIAAAEVVAELNVGGTLALQEPIRVSELADNDGLDRIDGSDSVRQLAKECFVLARVLVSL